jgi:hypothetical protein
VLDALSIPSHQPIPDGHVAVLPAEKLYRKIRSLPFG